MTKYKCGHTCYTIIMNTSTMGLLAYFTWTESVGYDGDKSKCFDCYCKELKR